MITKDDFQISNTSYTKKDFYQIYPETLELVSKITKRWDPDSSNESDPGLVLIKLNSFIADKLNYNIDKNILEDFMPSATQDSSMRKLCSLMGYNISYYKSATTDITFMYQGTGFEDGDISNYIKLPIFDSCITNEDGDINYILLEDLYLTAKYETKTVPAIEGTLCDVTVNDSNIIKLSNLDDNNRLYLPETSVAENGIWIKFNDGAVWVSDEWEKVDNLNTQVLGSYVWKFGYDSNEDLPYIEFPSDIANLIGNGLNIKYVRTSGVNGNVSANTLTVLASDTEAEDSEGNTITLTSGTNESSTLVITNKSASIDGTNKETIDEAYNGFKKTVGTFDTLITCRDYSNKIYNLVSDNDNTTPLVSNIQTADIRDDINRGVNLLTFTSYGKTFKNTAINDSINHFMLMAYPFKPITGAYTKTSYIKSFTPSASNWDIITSDLKNYKTIAHDIELPEDEDICCVKNYIDLNAKITTTYKVGTTEKKSILNNIYTSLYKNFNMRKVDFGEEIPTDSVQSCIEDADTRIKNVALGESTTITKLRTYGGNEYEVGGDWISDTSKNREYYIKLLAKNITAGRVSLFNYDERFNYEYGQSQFIWGTGNYNTIYGGAEATEKITSVTTGVNILSDANSSATTADTLYKYDFSAESGYTLKENEVIQMMSPSLTTTVTYPVYVNYFLQLNNADESGDEKYIPSNTEYALQAGDILYINYTDSDDTVYNIKYTYDAIYNNDIKTTLSTGEYNIIRPNFDFHDSAQIHFSEETSYAKSNPSVTWSIPGMYCLDTSEQIEIRDFVKTEITTTTPCYWIVNNTIDNKATITFSYDSDLQQYYYILQEGEYFFYTNSAYTELVTLGSGTKLVIPSTLTQNWVLDYDEASKIDVDEIANNGIGAFADVTWKNMKFTSTNKLTIQEMQFVTLTEDDILFSITGKIYNQTNNKVVLNNSWQKIYTADYMINGSSETTLPTFDFGSLTVAQWWIRSRLDLNLGPKLDQVLKDNQYFILQDNEESGTLPVTISPQYESGTSGDYLYPTLKCNYLMQQAGGENISTTIIEVNDEEEETEIDDLTVEVFSYTTPYYTNILSTPTTIEDLSLNTYDDIYTKIILSKQDNIHLPVLVNDSGFALIMFFYTPGIDLAAAIESGGSGVSLTLNSSVSGAGIKLFNTSNPLASPLILHEGINVIKINASGDLIINGNLDNVGTLLFDNIRLTNTTLYEGINMEVLGLDTNELHTINTKTEYNYLLDYIKTLSTINNIDIFYYNSILDNDLLIDTDDMSDYTVWYDHNNVNNKFVISELYAGNLDGTNTTPFANITLTKASLS